MAGSGRGLLYGTLPSFARMREEIRGNFIWLTGRNSKVESLEYEAALLPTQQQNFFNLSWAGYGSGSRWFVCPYPTLWPIRPPGQGVMEAIYFGVKRPQREYNQPSRPVMCLWMQPSVHWPAFLHAAHRDGSIFYLHAHIPGIKEENWNINLDVQNSQCFSNQFK